MDKLVAKNAADARTFAACVVTVVRELSRIQECTIEPRSIALSAFAHFTFVLEGLIVDREQLAFADFLSLKSRNERETRAEAVREPH